MPIFISRIHFSLVALAACLCLAGGCTRPAGVVFPPPEKPLVWPGPPETPRIRYVGQLVTSADLKPARPFGEAVDEALFGKKPSESMLTPFAICTDAANRIFVADAGAQAVHVFDLTTRKHARWAPPQPYRYSQPVGVAWDPRGRLFVSDSVGGCIFVFTSAGVFEARIGVGELTRPAGLAWDAANKRLLVADTASHCVVMLSSDGALLGRIGRRGTQPGEFNYPTNIAIDHQGRVYVSDTLNFRIQQFDPELRPTRVIGRKGDMPGCLSQPKGIAVDSEDHLYILDAHFEAVQVFDAQGQLLLGFGEEGWGPGQFCLPAGMFIDSRDRIWVADAYNRRLQVFDYVPEKQP